MPHPAPHGGTRPRTARSDLESLRRVVNAAATRFERLAAHGVTRPPGIEKSIRRWNRDWADVLRRYPDLQQRDRVSAALQAFSPLGNIAAGARRIVQALTDQLDHLGA